MKAPRNDQLKLMDVPAVTKVVEVKPNIRCGYCGGTEPAEGKRAVRVRNQNPSRTQSLYQVCKASAF